jgi:hypothetical protein
VIQQAIDRLPPGGGEVRLDPGVYVCARPVVIDRNGVCLRGSGPATVLRLAAGANAPVLVLGGLEAEPAVLRRNLCVSDLLVDGNRRNQTQECWGSGGGGGPCDAAHPIRNNGITLRRVENARVERVTVVGARSGGVVIEKNSLHVTVRDLIASDHHFDGLAAYRTRESVFSGLQLYNNCAAGLSFDLDFNGNTVSDVTISRDARIACAPPLQPGKVGIFMRQSRNNVFNGIRVHNTREHGVFIAQAEGRPATAATGNTFTALTVTASGQSAFRVNDASCTDNMLCAAQLTGNALGGLSEAVPGLTLPCGVHQTPPASRLPAVQGAIRELVRLTGVPAAQIVVLAVAEVQWSDSCLGVIRPGIACLQVITPGYRITLSAGQEHYELHTNADGSVVLLAGPG